MKKTNKAKSDREFSDEGLSIIDSIITAAMRKKGIIDEVYNSPEKRCQRVRQLITKYCEYYQKELTKKDINNFKEIANFFEAVEHAFREKTEPKPVPYLKTPNLAYYATTGKQKGKLESLSKDKTVRLLLMQKIKENPKLTLEEKEEELKKIADPSSNPYLKLDQYLGQEFTPLAHKVKRAIGVIVEQLVSSKTIESHHHPFGFPLYELYELCGVEKHKNGGHRPRDVKKILNILKDQESPLRQTMLVMNESNNLIRDTKCILETGFVSKKMMLKGKQVERYTHVIDMKISDLLFANHTCTGNFYLRDIGGYLEFDKINKTSVGLSIFLYCEKYLSIQDKVKELTLELIKNQVLSPLDLKAYKKNPKEGKELIDRAFADMITVGALIQDCKEEKDDLGEPKYILTNKRYKETSNIIELNSKKKFKVKAIKNPKK